MPASVISLAGHLELHHASLRMSLANRSCFVKDFIMT